MEINNPLLNKRIVYCLKLWINELKKLDPNNKDNDEAVQWVIAHVENEILNGTYCSDDEFNNYLTEFK